MTQSKTVVVKNLIQDVSKAKSVEESLRMKINNAFLTQQELTKEERDLLIKLAEDFTKPKENNK